MRTMTKRLRYLMAMLAFTGACTGDTIFVPGDTDIFVVQAFLFSGEPVAGVTVAGVLAVDADSTASAEPISGATVTLIRSSVRFELIETEGQPGHYHYPGTGLDIGIGEVFQLEATVGDRTATAETSVPHPPVGVQLSSDSIDAPTFGTPGQGRPGQGGLGGGLIARWDNPGSQLHFVVIDNIEENPVNLPTNPIFSRFAPRLIQQPTAADSSNVRVITLTHSGTHRLKLYRVNDEYADLYQGRNQDSRDLNEPPTNIRGALGIFSAFSADSTFFRVYDSSQ